jgi:cyclophilin family peptidyl-prolyl cis-trans isomerase
MRTLWVVSATVFALTACNQPGTSAATPAAKTPDSTPMTAATTVAMASSSGAGMTSASASPAATAAAASGKADAGIAALGIEMPKLDKSNPNWKYGTPQPKPFPAKFDAKKDYYATIHTTLGDITVKFYPEVAPKHVTAFLYLAQLGFYEDAPFHRVIPGFMMQGGDPSGQGNAGPAYHIPAEFNDRKHLRGTLAMARTPDPNSAGSQFYICFKPTPFLDKQYTVFGEVTSGLDVVDKFEKIGSPSGHPSSIEKIKSVDVFTKDKG